MVIRDKDSPESRTPDIMIGSAPPKSHFPAASHLDLPTAFGADNDTPCQCGGPGVGPPPPPPRFLLPPPPVNPAWATADADACDIVAPYQTCRALTGTPGPHERDEPTLPLLTVILTACGLLLIVLLVGVLFFCRYRRRVRGLLGGKAGGPAAKRSDTSRMLYDGLPVHTQVVPNSMRSNGQAPHIEMVAVKGEPCHPLMGGGRPVGVAGTLFVYPPPPSLTDEGSERASNMYEEIPYYGRQAPSVSYCSDSDDDVTSRPSDDVILPSDDELRRHGILPPSNPEDRGSRLERTPPRGIPRVPSQPRTNSTQHRKNPSMDRRRRSPVSPGFAPVGQAKQALRDESLRRKDPYYYSDILARRQHPGDVPSPSSDSAETYRRPFDEQRRPSSRGPAYCQPDVAVSPVRPPSALSRDRCDPSRDLASPRGHVSPLANRMAMDPFVDMYGSERESIRGRRGRNSFRKYADAGAGEHGTSDSGYMDVPPGLDQSTSERSRYHRPPQWTHS